MSDSVRPYRRQPTRFPGPWDSPGKNTGVCCHFLLQCMKVKSESEVAQLCPTSATPWTAAFQAPLSMGFSRQEYWSGVPLSSPCMYAWYPSNAKFYFKVARGKNREGSGTPLQYSCLENPTDGGAWKAAVHGVAEGQTQLREFTFTFHFHALEKEMATHSSVLAWRIPGTGEPGGRPSMGSHRVGHN